MNLEVITFDNDIPIDKLEAYGKELSAINERFFSSEKIGMADCNAEEQISIMKETEGHKST